MSTIDEQIAILQAAKEGKIIEVKSKQGKEWIKEWTKEWTKKVSDTFNFVDYEYRVKLEPKTIFVNECKWPEGALCSYNTKKLAEQAAKSCPKNVIRIGVEYKEVIKNES